MDSKAYSGGLAELRGLRDEIKPLQRDLAKLQAELAKLESRRDQRIVALGAFEKAKADRIATSAGVSVIDVVALVPSLGPQGAPSGPVDAPAAGPAVDLSEPQAAAQPIKEQAGTPAPDLRPAGQPTGPVAKTASEKDSDP
ncbi:hypothetical protein [Streptomyces sp. NPDC058671]|uniref:hypothetical protein n=1 Tax=Streptomyces sp. NPDC058671 TaxID=3346590 RepID=UPI0036656CC7